MVVVVVLLVLAVVGEGMQLLLIEALRIFVYFQVKVRIFVCSAQF